MEYSDQKHCLSMRSLLAVLSLVLLSLGGHSLYAALPAEYSFQQRGSISFSSLGAGITEKNIVTMEWQPDTYKFFVALNNGTTAKDLLVYEMGTLPFSVTQVAKIKTGLTVQAAAWDPIGRFIAVAGVNQNNVPAIQVYSFDLSKTPVLLLSSEFIADEAGGSFSDISWHFENRYLVASGAGLMFNEMGPLEMVMVLFGKQAGSRASSLEYLSSIDQNGDKALYRYMMVPHSDLIFQMPRTEVAEPHDCEEMRVRPTRSGNFRVMHFDLRSTVFDRKASFTGISAGAAAISMHAILQGDPGTYLDVAGALISVGTIKDDKRSKGTLLYFPFSVDFDDGEVLDPSAQVLFYANSKQRLDMVGMQQNTGSTTPDDRGLFLAGGLLFKRKLGVSVFRVDTDTNQITSLVSYPKVLVQVPKGQVLPATANVSQLAVSTGGQFISGTGIDKHVDFALVVGQNSPNATAIVLFEIVQR